MVESQSDSSNQAAAAQNVVDQEEVKQSSSIVAEEVSEASVSEALARVQEAARQVNKGSLTELKALNNPPVAVKNTMYHYINLFWPRSDGKAHPVPDASWVTTKKIMRNPQHVIDQLHSFDFDTVADAQLKKFMSAPIL